MVSSRDRPIYSIKAPTPKVSNRIPPLSSTIALPFYPNPDRHTIAHTIIILQLA
ncbi:hypothetical protein QUA40_06050 [Microcoleus sp. Pol11C3]|uniref:hypothetical protein n=1 Tax=Microcoleus sp. Pol11C3 TaxID=3055390 RepID=UPI002FCEA561